MAELYEKEKVFYISEVVKGEEPKYVSENFFTTLNIEGAKFFSDFDEAVKYGKVMKSCMPTRNYVVFSAYIEVNGFDVGHLIE